MNYILNDYINFLNVDDVAGCVNITPFTIRSLTWQGKAAVDINCKW